MSLGNPLPWFAIVALCLAAASGILLGSRFYRERLAEGGGRFEAIDGLRGFLALGVFGGHAVNMFTLHADGVWSAGLGTFHGRAAHAGVALFFMITGFLFWLRVLRQGEGFEVRAFLVSRLWRLTPMYLMSVLMVLLVAASLSGFALRVPLAQLVRELQPWLSFGFLDTGSVNGIAEAHAINAVYWTLAYEWAFYLALPLAALFARGYWSAALFLVVAFFAIRAPVVLNFVFGALAAMLVHHKVLSGRLGVLAGGLGSRWLAPLPLAALAAYFVLGEHLHKMLQPGLLFLFFVFLVHGYSAHGLFLSRPAKLLGTVSYSLYLTHCIVLFTTMHAVDRLVPIATLDPVQYWMLAAFAGLATVVLSAVTYRYVEYPWLKGVPYALATSLRRSV
jgi:peptidoglycan/LPS O-acetylase OafA/YrhL